LLGNSQVVAVAGAMQAPRRDASWVERAWYELAHASPGSAAKPARWLATFNLLVRRDAFERAGGFDESLATCEDCDLGYKLAEFGTSVLDPRTQVVHWGESQSLGELFRREAWRTRGNLQLALARPLDWSNWFSLLAPPGLLAVLLLSIAGTAIASVVGQPVWPWLVVVCIALSLLTATLIMKGRPTNLLTFGRQMIVLLTYSAGRAAGLFWPFRRVER
jgi:hypothetical protein